MDLKGRRVLVTGGAGFIGSHLVDALVARGATVAVLDNLSTGRRDHVNPKATFYRAGIDSERLMRVFAEQRPEIVYHLAANTNVPLSVRQPLVELVSLAGAVNVLECSRRTGVGRILLTSSGFIYGNAARRPVKETAPFQPISPYAITKKAIEYYMLYYRQTIGLPCVILRLATVYGPRQVTGAMADYIRQLTWNKQAVIYGRAKTRDYVYVDDVVDALMRVLDLPEDHPEPIFNVGTGRETSLVELYRKIAALLNRPARPVFEPDRGGELIRYSLDSSKLRRVLRWVARVSLDEGLRRTVRAFTEAQ